MAQSNIIMTVPDKREKRQWEGKADLAKGIMEELDRKARENADDFWQEMESGWTN
ncbi:MAG: hypothetical protein ACK56F_05415 [bacterium]